MTPLSLLKDWVALRHEGQIIRRTGEPYFDHLLAVAAMSGTGARCGYEIGLCHDLLEKTTTTEEELPGVLTGFGYKASDADFITFCVVELTDVFTAEHYPSLSKIERKQLEANRLAAVSPAAQTVKYADLIYNIDWVLKYDQKNAVSYLRKKQSLLKEMNLGNQVLRQRALDLILQIGLL